MRRIRFPLLPRWARLGGVAVLAGLIFYFSLLDAPPKAPPGGGPALPVRRYHLVAYAALALALAYATVEDRDEWRQRLVLVVLVPVLYGAFIEFLQAPLPDRYYAVGDLAANTTGAVLSVAWLLLESRVRYLRVSELLQDLRRGR